MRCCLGGLVGDSWFSCWFVLVFRLQLVSFWVVVWLVVDWWSVFVDEVGCRFNGLVIFGWFVW